MAMKAAFGLAAAIALLPIWGGCQSAQLPRAALLTQPSPAAIGELEQTISTALGGIDITLTEQVFADSSVLTLEPARRQTPAGRTASSRIDERPQQFQLLQTSDGCILEWLNTQQRFGLTHTHCRAE